MVETRSQSKAAEEGNGSSINHVKNEALEPKKNGDKAPAAADEKSSVADGDSDVKPHTSTLTIIWCIIIAAISVFTYPESLQPIGRPTLNHVWYFGWISALSTGLGVLPLVFSPDLDTYYIGVTNGKNYLSVHFLDCLGA